MSLVQPDPPISGFASGPSGADIAAEPRQALAQRWVLLHRHLAVLAPLADLSPETNTAAEDAFPSLIAAANAWQCELVRQGMEDIDALMQPGLTALQTIAARGRDATTPALALWREFHAARAAVLAVLSPGAVGADRASA